MAFYKAQTRTLCVLSGMQRFEPASRPVLFLFCTDSDNSAFALRQQFWRSGGVGIKNIEKLARVIVATDKTLAFVLKFIKYGLAIAGEAFKPHSYRSSEHLINLCFGKNLSIKHESVSLPFPVDPS